jgi:hypothetical protein
MVHAMKTYGLHIKSLITFFMLLPFASALSDTPDNANDAVLAALSVRILSWAIQHMLLVILSTLIIYALAIYILAKLAKANNVSIRTTIKNLFVFCGCFVCNCILLWWPLSGIPSDIKSIIMLLMLYSLPAVYLSRSFEVHMFKAFVIVFIAELATIIIVGAAPIP